MTVDPYTIPANSWCVGQSISYAFSQTDMSPLPAWITPIGNTLSWTSADEALDIDILVTATTAADRDVT